MGPTWGQSEEANYSRPSLLSLFLNSDLLAVSSFFHFPHGIITRSVMTTKCRVSVAITLRVMT